MFHVEQKETHIEVVDHFLTKETFKIQKTWLPGLLKTHPTPSKNEIQKYINEHRIKKRAKELRGTPGNSIEPWGVHYETIRTFLITGPGPGQGILGPRIPRT